MRNLSFGSNLLLFLLAFLLSVPWAMADPVGPFIWVAKAPVIGVPPFGAGVEGAATSVIGGSIYASHGHSFGDNAFLRIYSIAGNSWALGPTASVPRSEGAGATAGGKHYSIGGRPPVAGVGDAVEIFDPGTGIWSFGAPMPTPRAGFCATELNGKIHTIGGRTGSTPATGIALSAHEVYDPALNTWSPAAPLPTAVMDDYACVSLKGKIYVFGGDSFGGGFTGITQIYNPVTNTWSSGAPMPTARSNAIAGVLDCHPVVIGGYQGFGNLNVVEIYHPNTDTWTPGPAKPTPASELGVSMPGSGTSIFAVGSGIFGASSPVHEALVGGVAGCPCDPNPLTQGYWHRQCLGAGLITPGRSGRGPDTILEPDFLKTLVPAVNARLQASIFVPPTFRTCEDGMDAVPPSDPCERALKQYTALLLNIESDRLQETCDIDLALLGCSSTTVGQLAGELAGLINSADPDSCRLAADCAGAINENQGIVSSLAPATAAATEALGAAADVSVTAANTTVPAPQPGDRTVYPRVDPSVAARGTGMVTAMSPEAGVAKAKAPEASVTTPGDATGALAPIIVLRPEEAPRADSAERSRAETERSDGESEAPAPETGSAIDRHLAVLANASSSEKAREASVNALLTALGGGYDLDVRLRIARALVGEVDVAYRSLLDRHLEDIRDEAMSVGDNRSKKEANKLLKRLPASAETKPE